MIYCRLSKILNDHVCSSDLQWELIRETKTSNDEWFWGILHEKIGKIELEDWAKKEKEIKDRPKFM